MKDSPSVSWTLLQPKFCSMAEIAMNTTEEEEELLDYEDEARIQAQGKKGNMRMQGTV